MRSNVQAAGNLEGTPSKATSGSGEQLVPRAMRGAVRFQPKRSPPRKSTSASDSLFCFSVDLRPWTLNDQRSIDVVLFDVLLDLVIQGFGNCHTA
jgi:hypothetical protein